MLAVAPAEDVGGRGAAAAPELRADAGAVSDRGATLAAVAVERLVEAAEPGPPRRAGAALALELGEHAGYLALSYPGGRPALGRGVRAGGARRRRSSRSTGCAPRALLLPGHVLGASRICGRRSGRRIRCGWRRPSARLGVSPLDEDALEALEPQLLAVLAPSGSVARAHDDPDPRRRVMRRILQRLDGMGKWGGYHTAFDHLARGFAGNDRALAYEVGEELLDAGLLEQKPSVGQRHVYLNARAGGRDQEADRRGRAAGGLSAPSASRTA